MIPAWHTKISKAYYARQGRRGVVGSAAQTQEFERLVTSSADAVREVQTRRLAKLLDHASKHVPYFQNLFNERGITLNYDNPFETLAKLPLVDKPTMRDAGENYLSTAIPRSEMHSNASGGSTGAPLHFYRGPNFRKASLIASFSLDQWTGWIPGEPVAVLWGAPTDLERYGLLREKIRLWLKNRFTVDAFDLNETKLKTAAGKLRGRRPKLVVAYASAAYLVAKYMADYGIQLNPGPRAVITSAEVLWPHYRTVIQQQFNCKVHNRYGSREVGMIAMECAHGRLHVNAPDVHLEVIDPDENGIGELVITQLHNYAFPFIRYRIGDRGKLGHESCPCGRHLPVLSDLVGRVTDYIVSPQGAVIHGEWFTHLFYEMQGVVMFTFRQTARDEYCFQIQRSASFKEEDFALALRKSQERLGPDAKISVQYVEQFDSSPSGKHRFVINECADLADVHQHQSGATSDTLTA
jgi:phenylacetate-CoA ligase